MRYLRIIEKYPIDGIVWWTICCFIPWIKILSQISSTYSSKIESQHTESDNLKHLFMWTLSHLSALPDVSFHISRNICQLNYLPIKSFMLYFRWNLKNRSLFIHLYIFNTFYLIWFCSGCSLIFQTLQTF